METQQRFLRRLFLLQNISDILREAAYYRAHKQDIMMPELPLWKFDDAEGTLAIK